MRVHNYPSLSSQNSGIQAPTTQRGRTEVLCKWNAVYMMTSSARSVLIHEKHYTQYDTYGYYQANGDDDLYNFPTSVPFSKRNVR